MSINNNANDGGNANEDPSAQAGQQGTGEEMVSKAEYDKLSKELNQAQYLLTKTKQEAKSAPTSAEIEELVRKTAESVLQAEKAEKAAEYIEEAINLSGKTDEEKAAIREIYDKRISKSGIAKENIIADIEAASAIYLSSKTRFTAEEIKARDKANNFSNTSNTSGGADFKGDFSDNKEINMTPKEASFASAFGIIDKLNK